MNLFDPSNSPSNFAHLILKSLYSSSIFSNLFSLNSSSDLTSFNTFNFLNEFSNSSLVSSSFIFKLSFSALYIFAFFISSRGGSLPFDTMIQSFPTETISSATIVILVSNLKSFDSERERP
ncbi:MAG: hypothetical protein BWX56_01663 [Euryarchaeota archaeon ADurb.Bin023]|nr:MAG: hypothetical protein BWX56_01663 [Euryarchaeota archaeon ADurb.Bin023]